MKRNILLLAMMFAVFTCSAVAQSKDEEAVKKSVLQFTGGMEKGDIKQIEEVWVDDDEITVFEGGGMDKGWKNYRDKHLVPEMKYYKNLKYDLNEMTVKVSGKMALVRSRFLITAGEPDKKTETKGLISAVLEKRKGKWLIVHWHLSASRKQ
jgi:ketosteroid isomerase-like protein